MVDEWDAFVAASERPEPTVVRVRTGRISEADLVERLERQGFGSFPIEGMPGFLRVEGGPGPVSATLEHWDGLVYVQQASTGVAAPALGALPGERVLDLCAAPGGKTSHLAELVGERGCVIASEIDERRVRGLLGNLYRLCHTNVLVVAGDSRDFPEGALFDRVLVDAPCSGEGTLRRRSGEVPNQSRSFVDRVARAQRALLRKAVRLTRPGGTILYVTCTFAPEENEAVVSDILAEGGIELEPLALAVPHAPGLTSFEGVDFDPRLAGAARVYPHHLDSGGLFMARLRRLDDAAETAREAWLAVPVAFPDEEVGGRPEDLVEGTLDALSFRYGIDRTELTAADGTSWRWIIRAGRIWVHTLREWPLPAWRSGDWRPISIGLRAFEFDSTGRPRPTNDFLRLLGERVRSARVELDEARLASLVAGGAASGPPSVADDDVPSRLGPVALVTAGTVVGRGAYTRRGLVSEIPKARAVDLTRALDARGAGSEKGSGAQNQTGGEEGVGGGEG